MTNPYERTLDDAKALVALREAEIEAHQSRSEAPRRPLMGDALTVYTGIAQAQSLCHALADRSGWWSNLDTGAPIDPHDPLVFGQKIALIHSEVSEAMEGHRKSLMDDHLPHRRMVEVELADLLIRVFDTAGAMRLDLAGAMIEKLAYNQERADHKLENRRSENGKAY